MCIHVYEAWDKSGFNIQDASQAQLGNLDLEELKSVIGTDGSEFVADARTLLKARMEFLHMDKTRFLAVCPTLLERRVPHELIQQMSLLGIEPNEHNLPSSKDLQLASSCELKKFGKGVMGTAFRTTLNDEEWVFKPEQKEPSIAAKGTGIPEKGANTAGRILASAAVSALYGQDTIPEARPFWAPAADGLPCRYGTISRLVKGSMVQSGSGDSGVVSLNSFEMNTATKELTAIKERARQHGFTDVQLDRKKKELQLTTSREFRRPLDLKSVPLMKSLIEANVTEILTGQLDNHAGNLLLSDDQQVRIIDTAESFPPSMLDPLAQITEPAPGLAAWPDHFTAVLKRVRDNSFPPAVPKTVAKCQIDQLMKMTAEEAFGEDWKSDLSQIQRVQVESALKRAQKKLRQSMDGSPNPPVTITADRVATSSNSAAHVHGWPPVIPSALKKRVLETTQEAHAQSLQGLVTPQEIDANWSRIVAFQQALQTDDLILEVKSDDQWSSAEVIDRLGWNPGQLDKHAEMMLAFAAKDQSFAWLAAKREVALKHGLPGVLALEERMAQMQSSGSFDRGQIAPGGRDPGHIGHALLDRDALLAPFPAKT